MCWDDAVTGASAMMPFSAKNNVPDVSSIVYSPEYRIQHYSYDDKVVRFQHIVMIKISCENLFMRYK